jgi:hypothetical protein
MATMMTRSILIALSLTGCTMATEQEPSTPPAVATPLDQARAHYRHGYDRYLAADYAGSLDAFQRAYDLSPNWRVRYNIGEMHYQLDHFVEARFELASYLREGGVEVPKERRRFVESDIAELDRILGNTPRE